MCARLVEKSLLLMRQKRLVVVSHSSRSGRAGVSLAPAEAEDEGEKEMGSEFFCGVSGHSVAMSLLLLGW